MKVVFINNKDSFVWNLVDYISYFEKDTLVLPNTISLDELREIKPDALVISPGPGSPSDPKDIGNCLEIIREMGEEIPLLGVCLGHQAINVAFGGLVRRSKVGPVHGKVQRFFIRNLHCLQPSKNNSRQAAITPLRLASLHLE